MKNLYLFIFASLITTVSSFAQDPGNYYKSCMDSKLSHKGIDFYQEMDKAEKLLIKNGVLQGTDRKDYLYAFTKLFENENQADLYAKIDQEFLTDLDLYSVSLELFSFCSDIEILDNKNGCNCLNINKNILKKFVRRPYNDEELLDDMFVFTDFGDDVLRKHMTYLFLLNLKIKYGKK
ncbi:hypothetical protein [Salinimicrobium sp. TH3]|uniref:hypothetical protein n=1 Tax=Salinimicrobium sp. TH3 TaxID=2997342 RepID=UPI0022733824|nr:hypothetical protein [Salinimicrobium sp. TH3]MCY2686793.1 hypothetical protein [Salinimicrobium sp. TH3]